MVGRGFADALRIGNQARPRLFDLEVKLPALLHERVVEVGGRIAVDGAELEPLDEAAAAEAFAAGGGGRHRRLRHRADACLEIPGTTSSAWPPWRGQAGFAQVSASHATSPLLRLVPRGDTTVVDAYLSPILRRYVDQVAAELPGVKLYFMQSNGGLAEAAAFGGKDAILSGPAGGIVGAARTAAAAGIDSIIGFDMGGTSTDVALYDGAFERAFETEVAGVRIRAPMMAINTVAAGGGSILHNEGARYRVGPDSAGAAPGPACYRRGGPLTVTDANVMVGKIHPRISRAIFGPGGDQRLDAAVVAERFAALVPGQDPRVAAEGFLRIAVANMANAIKQVSLQKGHDAGRFALQCFGGAGGQHACLVADELGMQTVFIHPYRRRPLGLRHGPRRPDRAAGAGGGNRASPAILRHWTRPGRRVGGRGQRRRWWHRAPTQRRFHPRRAAGACALRRHPGGAGSAARAGDCNRPHFTAAHRARFGFATPERGAGGRGGGGGGDRARGNGCAEARHRRRGRRMRQRRNRSTQVTIWTGGAEHAAPVFERTTLLAGDRRARPGADPRGQCHDGRRARLDRRGHVLSTTCCSAGPSAPAPPLKKPSPPGRGLGEGASLARSRSTQPSATQPSPHPRGRGRRKRDR